MTAQVLQEYLVSLGFAVNQAQLRNFGDALKGTAASAAKLGAEAVATGVALTEMVSAVAKQFEDLYYMSQRTGATVTNLQAVSYAATQIGVSADEAKGAIEGFASAMRRQPGLRNLFEGVTKHKLTGDPEVDIRTFVRSQRGVADYIALQRADQLNIPEHLYLQYKNNNNLERMESSEVEYLRRLKEAHLDYGPDDRRWVDFENTLGHLASQFGIIGKRIAEDFRPAVQSVIEDIDKMVGRFGPADVASGGKLGEAAGLAGAGGASTGIMGLIWKIFGIGKGGKGVGPKLSGGGFVSLLTAVDALMDPANAKDVDELRTALRTVFGIDDPHEKPPWETGGSGSTVRAFQKLLGGPAGGGPSESGGSGLPMPRGSFTVPQGNITAGDIVDYAPAAGANNSRTSTFNMNQTNSYVASNYPDAKQIGSFAESSNTSFAAAMRVLAAKLQ